MKISFIAKGLLVVALTAIFCVATDATVSAQKKKKEKAKKEKITDPRLLTVMSMTKMSKESQYIVKNRALKTNHRAVQGFDISADGTMWYSQPGQIGKNQQGLTKIHENYIVRIKDGKRETMTLRYFGGANNIAIENAADGDYIWIGSNGDKWHGHYHRTRTISRVPFTVDGEANNGYAGETYYLGGNSARYTWPSIDVENDLLCVSTQNAGAVTVHIYNLTEARSLSDSNIKLKTTWKGEMVGEDEETVVRTIKAKDLTTLEPLYTFTIAKPDKETADPAKVPNYYTYRALDIDKDYVYFVEGQHNKGNKKVESKGYITVFDHAGRVVLPKRRIQAIHDMYLLENIGITPNGYADVAGIQVKGSTIYILFAAQNIDSRGKKVLRANVVKYE